MTDGALVENQDFISTDLETDLQFKKGPNEQVDVSSDSANKEVKMNNLEGATQSEYVLVIGEGGKQFNIHMEKAALMGKLIDGMLTTRDEMTKALDILEKDGAAFDAYRGYYLAKREFQRRQEIRKEIQPINQLSSVNSVLASELVNSDYETATSQTEVIDSVLERGLMSRRLLEERGIMHVGSMDKKDPVLDAKGSATVESIRLPKNLSLQESSLNLYDGPFATFPVLLERSYGKYLNSEDWTEVDRWVASSRAQSSFVVIFEGKSLESEVPLEKIRGFVFPQIIYDEYVKIHGKPPETTIPIWVIGYTYKNINNRGEAAVPDYELALLTVSGYREELLENQKGDLCAHVVRLPTQEDLTERDSHLVEKTQLDRAV